MMGAKNGGKLLDAGRREWRLRLSAIDISVASNTKSQRDMSSYR